MAVLPEDSFVLYVNPVFWSDPATHTGGPTPPFHERAEHGIPPCSSFSSISPSALQDVGSVPLRAEFRDHTHAADPAPGTRVGGGLGSRFCATAAIINSVRFPRWHYLVM